MVDTRSRSIKRYRNVWIMVWYQPGIAENFSAASSNSEAFSAAETNDRLIPNSTKWKPINWLINHKKTQVILGAVSDKCPGFCKCSRFSKSGSATFSDSAGCQKWPALSTSYRRSVMMMATTINSIIVLLLTTILI